MTKIVLILLAVTLLGYAGLYLYVRFYKTPETAVCEMEMHRETVAVTGVFVREETVLTAKRSFSSVTAGAGERVAAGDTLGVSYDSDASLRRASKLLRLENEIAALEQALARYEENGGASAGDGRRAAQSLAADIADHDTDELNLDALLARLQVLDGGYESVLAELAAMRKTREGLLAQSAGDTELLTAPTGGIFSPDVDGFEKLTPAALTGLTCSSLDLLLESAGNTDARSYGKLVPSFNWYLAAVIDEKEVGRLRVGAEFPIDLSRYGAGEPIATLRSISEAEDGRCVLVFCSDRSLTDTLSLRNVSCGIVTETVRGLRVPSSALHEDRITGARYVLLGGGSSAQRADVSVAYENNGYALVDGELLREGSLVLTESRIRAGQLLP